RHYLVLPSFPTRRSSDLNFCFRPWDGHNSSRTLNLAHSLDNRRTQFLLDVIHSQVGIHLNWYDVIDRQREAAFTDQSPPVAGRRSEEHTSELQSPYDLVC